MNYSNLGGYSLDSESQTIQDGNWSRIKKRKSSPINFAIALFFFSSLLYNVESIQIIGYFLLITSILFFSLCLTSGKNIQIKNDSVYRICILFLTALFLTELLRRISFRGFEVLVCFYIALIVFHAFATVDLHTIKKKRIKIFLWFEIFLLFVPIALGIGYSPIDGGYWSFYSTTTFLGFFSCLQIEICVLIYFITKEKGWLWLIIPLMALVYLSRVRTAYVGVLIILFTLLLQSYTLTRRPRFYRLMKWIFIGGILAFVVIYPQLDQFEWYGGVEALVYLYTGKILLSGRNEIWAEGFQYVSHSPYFGYGLDTSFIDISMHNSYLQMILESGAVGMIGLVILINCVLNQISSNNGRQYKLVFIYTLVNLLMATTEVMLFHGQMILEVLVWSIMGLGVNKTLYKV